MAKEMPHMHGKARQYDVTVIGAPDSWEHPETRE
jgi:hypothetical protein